jgi:hypothetical protein
MSSDLLRQWEKRLNHILDLLDLLFETKYGTQYRLHPVRAKQGTTANPASDGLFNITPKFTLGYGSELGEGYVVDIHLSTLESVTTEFKKQLETEAMLFLEEKLLNEFNGHLCVSHDTTGLKIHGDLTLHPQNQP